MGEKLDLAAIISGLEKKYGKGLVEVASQAKALSTWRRIETGIFAIDHIAGGGIPYGAATLLEGLESGGKTLVAMKAIAGSQRMCREHVLRMEPTGKSLWVCPLCGHKDKEKKPCPHPNCSGQEMSDLSPELACPQCKKYNPNRTLYADSEGGFTNNWAARLGVDCDLVHVLRPQSAEQAIDSAMLLLESGEFDVFVVDSIAQLTPDIENQESIEKVQPGSQARLMNKALRTLLSHMNSSGVEKLRRMTLLLINQIRYKIGGNPWDNITHPGGKGQDYAAVLQLHFRTAKEEKDELGNTISAIIAVEVKKNKTAGTSRSEANFRFWKRDCIVDEEEKLVGSTDEHIVLTEYGLAHKVIEGTSGSYKIGEFKCSTQDEIRKLLKSSYKAASFVRDALMNRMLGSIWYSIAALEKARKKKAAYDS